MGATQVETGGVKDDAVTSGKIPDNAVGNTEIANGAVTLAKLANGDSNSDGKVLTSNNGSAPTFNTPTAEGTAIKSTGETNTAKFLRVDGDGTSSWQIPTGSAEVSTSAAGLAPQLPNPHGGKFLRGDKTWVVPYSTVDTTANGLAPQLPNPHGGKFLKADGTWEVPAYIANTDTTYSIFTTSTNGLVPGTASGGGDSAKFLKGDATWAVPTAATVTTGSSGVVAALPSSDATTKFLRGDNTWVVPPDTTYSLVSASSQGIAPIGLNPHGDKYLRADGTWQTTPDTNTTYSVGDGGLTQNNFTDALKSKLDGIDTGAEVNVQSDWNASSGDAQILNKPTIPDVSGKADLSGATFTGHININDDMKLRFGTDNDISFYHNDSNFFVNNIKGDLHLRTTNNGGSQTGDDIYIRAADDVHIQANGGDAGIKVIGEGAAELYHNDVGPKLATTSTGISVDGNITVSGTVDGVDVAKLDALAYCNLNKTSATENINVAYANRVSIKWDNKVYKSTTYTHSTTTDSEKVEVGSAGLYMINVTVGHDNTNTTRVVPNISIFKNDTEITETRASTYGRGSNRGDEKAMQINTVLQLASGDHLEVWAWCPFAEDTNAVNTVVGDCEFVMTRLAGGVEAE